MSRVLCRNCDATYSHIAHMIPPYFYLLHFFVLLRQLQWGRIFLEGVLSETNISLWSIFLENLKWIRKYCEIKHGENFLKIFCPNVAGITLLHVFFVVSFKLMSACTVGDFIGWQAVKFIIKSGFSSSNGITSINRQKALYRFCREKDIRFF